MTDLSKEIENSLVTDDTDLNRKRWAKKFASKEIALKNFLYLVDFDQKLATRFIWLIGDLCESNPRIVFPVVKDFFSRRATTKIVNYNRSLAKMFMYCGIPKEIEGEATTNLFNWLMDANSIVTTKVYSMKALFNLTKKYPELISELEAIIRDQYDKNSVSFKTTANQILNKLGRINIRL